MRGRGIGLSDARFRILEFGLGFCALDRLQLTWQRQHFRQFHDLDRPRRIGGERSRCRIVVVDVRWNEVVGTARKRPSQRSG